MTDIQQAEREAIKRLVDECGWEWRVGDFVEKNGEPFVVILKESSIGYLSVFHSTDNSCGPDAIHVEDAYPYPDTWLEGRLRKRLGDAFHSLNKQLTEHTPRETYDCVFFCGGQYTNTGWLPYTNTGWLPSPICALAEAVIAVEGRE
jgi:hypothetical protein